MEVHVKADDGVAVPDGCYMSIKVGGTRKESLLSSGRAFRFPDKAQSDIPLKFELLKPIATGYIVPRPDTESYKVAMAVEGILDEMCFKVDLNNAECTTPDKGTRGSVTDTEDASQVAARKAETNELAKGYLEEKGILTFLQAVLQTVVLEKPADPFKAIAKHFAAGFLPVEEDGARAKDEGVAEKIDEEEELGRKPVQLVEEGSHAQQPPEASRASPSFAAASLASRAARQQQVVRGDQPSLQARLHQDPVDTEASMLSVSDDKPAGGKCEKAAELINKSQGSLRWPSLSSQSLRRLC